MSNRYHYDLAGGARKKFIDTLSRILDTPAIYQKAPTFSYRIGGCDVDKDGILSFSTNTSTEEIQQLLAALREEGFMPGREDATVSEGAVETIGVPHEKEAEDSAGISISEVAAGPDTLTVEIPRAGMTGTAYDNLQKIIASKAALLRQALDTDTLEIKVSEEKLSFPWFTLHGLEKEADAYIQLITAMVKMAKRQKRVIATEKPIENAKFEMRLFLVRLGFIGDEYKAARKLLLRNLTGNSSWKSGRSPKEQAEGISEMPPDPETASSYVPANTENIEMGGTSRDSLSDAFPEDEGSAP